MHHQPAAVVKSKLTAVFQLQRAEGNLHVAGEARHHLAVHVSAAAEVPLLEPVEVAGAGQRVVPQDAVGRKKGNGKENFFFFQMFSRGSFFSGYEKYFGGILGNIPSFFFFQKKLQSVGLYWE